MPQDPSPSIRLKYKNDSYFTKSAQISFDPTLGQWGTPLEEIPSIGLFESLRPSFVVGKYLGLFSFRIEQEQLIGEPRCWCVKSSKKLRGLILSFKCILTLYMGYLVAMEKSRVKFLAIMDWLWKFSFCFFSVNVVTILWWFELYRRKWPKIFEKASEVQREFDMIGIKLNFRYFPRITLIISIFHVLFSVAHCYIAKYFDTGFLNLMQVSSSAGAWTGFQKWLGFGLKAFAVVLDFFAWNAWHFADTFRSILAIYIWRLFRALNNGVKDFGSEKLEEVMCLHTKIMDLLRSMNQTISGVTFVGSIYMVIYSCLLINYFLRDYGTIGRGILTVHFLLKNLIIYGVSADVNAKAHAIADWMQNSATEKEFKLNSCSTNKLIIFASQVYSKDSIGFKGLQFFTITASFLTAIFSGIATYTIVITQLLDQNKTGMEK